MYINTSYFFMIQKIHKAIFQMLNLQHKNYYTDIKESHTFSF